MLTRLNFIQKSMRQLLSTFSLTFKQWGLLLSLPILLSLGISYAITNYVVHDKAREVGNFNLERLDELLLQSDGISEFAMTLKEGDCGKLGEYMKFRPYYRGVLLFNDKAFYCSSMTGDIELPLNSLLPEYQLKDSARYIVPETPARLGVPAIIAISKDAQSHRGAIVVLEGQYLIDSFIQPEVFPRPVSTVVLGMHGATLPSVPQFGEGEIVTVLADDKEFLVLLEVSNAFFMHFFWIYFGLLLPVLFIFVLLFGLLLWRKNSRHSLVDDIRSGIENQEFFLVYQPVIGTEDGKVQGVEALVRWQHPQMGLVRPDLFIHIAEENQLIVPLTNYIFERALADFANMTVAAGFKIGFNVAPEHFTQDDIEAKFIHLRDSLARIGVKPLIEITERQLLTVDICQRIEGLRQLGILVAIDDFGTGQTTLSLLQTMQLDYLKIDKCFIDTIGQESVTSHVLDTIIELSHKMNYVVVAEGVETQEQADYLTHRQVHFLQGYLFAKPMKLEDLKLWLAAERS
ncbi:EAL domain-containing protein [Shewanella putrefaciens]|uniref:EAL domain-containing protein n=1 Tax=Shewanella putrefaciens TaxID=24 RepID=UPI0018E88E79|nr:EAL domain-containing protein [Shewanella putrefaciens]